MQTPRLWRHQGQLAHFTARCLNPAHSSCRSLIATTPGLEEARSHGSRSSSCSGHSMPLTTWCWTSSGSCLHCSPMLRRPSKAICARSSVHCEWQGSGGADEFAACAKIKGAEEGKKREETVGSGEEHVLRTMALACGRSPCSSEEQVHPERTSCYRLLRDVNSVIALFRST